jgi:hypothetical protein
MKTSDCSQLLVVLLGVVVAGCGNTASETELPSSLQRAIESADPDKSDPDTIGFIHTVEHSRFSIGALLEQKSEFGFSKTIGANGVFGTVARSGWAMGIPNADSPAKKVAPLTSSEEVHNNAVRDYFVAAGLPFGQIAHIAAHASMHQGPALGDLVNEPLVFDGFTSVISRQIDGIFVSESFASATFNGDGDVVEESVYWPTVPAAVVNAAKEFRDLVTDPVSAKLFVSSLPDGMTAGTVLIHHSYGDAWASDEVQVSYDVVAASGRIRHFDRHGAEFEFKRELSPRPVSAQKKMFSPAVPKR